MQKVQFKVQLSDEIIARLDKLGEIVGQQSGNIIAAMVLSEFSNVKPTSGAIWEALGRIHEEATIKTVPLEIENTPTGLTRSKREALPVSR